MANDGCKIIIDGETKTITLQEDIATIKRIFNKDLNDELTLKSIGEICNNKINFYVASYQRGYRWGKDEVNALLDDIYEVYSQKDKAQNYCLQPLVVKKCNNVKYKQQLSSLFDFLKEGKDNISNEDKDLKQEAYELLDGQQRLTTLWILLDSLDSNSNHMYSIYYELIRNVDEDFIKESKKTINDWLESKKQNYEENNFYEKYKNIILENIYFIWYEVKRDESTQGTNSSQVHSEKLFRKINKGKIELTNAELFKAMLLNSENAHNKKEQDELIQISFEWDKIEQSLRNDDFWFFISNDSSEERTRIDYILEVYARTLDKDNKYDVGKDRYSFLVVHEGINSEKDSNISSEFEIIKKAWQGIVHIHDKLYSWYHDNELYHNIGFLVACEGKRRGIASDTIVNLYKDVKDEGIEETRNIVKGKIYDYLVIKKWKYREEGQGRGKKRKKYYDIALSEKYELENLSYDSDKKYIADFLLFSNIYPLIKKDEKGDYSKGRFPFKLYYNDTWDIEHINPQTPKRGNIIDDILRCGNVDLVWQYLDKCHHDEIKNIKEEERNDKTLKEIWKDYFLDGGGDDIGNLVLLNSKINREYHNALFNQKRAKIIDYDKKGIFIPLATKNVFLKYYTENPNEFIVWDNNDIEGYMNHLKEIFDEVSTWSKFSQKNNTELK